MTLFIVDGVKAGDLQVEFLNQADHTGLSHVGLTGVNSFDETAHDADDHTVAPHSLLSQLAHTLLLHTGLGLLDEPAHDVLSHVGLTGVNNFDSAAHDAEDHTQAPFNLLDTTAHALLSHAGFPGVDLRAHIIDRASAVGGSITFNPSTLPSPFVPVVLISFLFDAVATFIGFGKGTGAANQSSLTIGVGPSFSALTAGIFSAQPAVSITSFTSTLVTVSGGGVGAWGGTVMVFGNRT